MSNSNTEYRKLDRNEMVERLEAIYQPRHYDKYLRAVEDYNWGTIMGSLLSMAGYSEEDLDWLTHADTEEVASTMLERHAEDSEYVLTPNDEALAEEEESGGMSEEEYLEEIMEIEEQDAEEQRRWYPDPLDSYECNYRGLPGYRASDFI